MAGGTQKLSGAQTYTDTTTIESGATLQVDGSLTSEVTIEAGGVLQGTNTIGTLASKRNVSNSGTLRPGSSPGTTTINGNYTQDSDGALEIEIAGTGAGQFDRLVVNGAASFAGMMNILLTDGFYFANGPTLLSLIDYTSHTGEFTGLSLNGTGCASGGAGAWNCGAHLTFTEQSYATHMDLLVRRRSPRRWHCSASAWRGWASPAAAPADTGPADLRLPRGETGKLPLPAGYRHGGPGPVVLPAPLGGIIV